MLKIRIIFGILKGSFILLPDLYLVKPTRLVIKESIFSIIGLNINNFLCLDLFCGTGSLGIECLSIGVNRVIFIDNSNKLIRILKGNLKRLFNNNNYTVLRYDAIKYLLIDNNVYDLIFFDPPYNFKLNINYIINLLILKIKFGGYLYYECSGKHFININLGIKLIKIGFRGKVIYMIYKKN